MPYFDLTTNGTLLKKATRENADIEQLVSQAEYDLFDFYREVARNTHGTALQGVTRIQTGLQNLSVNSGHTKVMLMHYKVDPADLTTDNELQFLADVQRAIAILVEERVAQSGRDPGVKSEKKGRLSVSYFENSSVPGFSVSSSALRYTQKYDIRTPV